MFRKILTVQSSKVRFLATTVSSTIDSKEVEHFEKLAFDWWDEFGTAKPLHSMNKLRVPFVRDGLVNANKIDLKEIDTPFPLKGISILDIGCGGGILSEPLARLGGNVTGLDANLSLIELAQSHSKLQKLDIEYVSSSIEEHASCNSEKYDAIVASEILEHVSLKPEFIEACVNCLKPNGSIFITTINKTFLSNFAGIFLAEKMLRLLPEGTHQYDKFIEPHKLQRILEDYNCRTQLVHGMYYNMFTNTWHWCSNTSVNYGIHAIKTS